MLRSSKKLEGYKIHAKDGNIGKVYDFYFDDRTWAVRYLVADTGGWLEQRQVLISPQSLGSPAWESEEFPINLSKEQIENSPDISNDEPISLHKEHELTTYYGWPDYWLGGGYYVPSLGVVPPVAFNTAEREVKEQEKSETEEGNHNLRSVREITGYNIKAADGSIGHVEDFIVDDAGWIIRYLVVDTRNILPGGKKVIIQLDWIKRMDWSESRVYLHLTKDQITNSPEFDPSKPLSKEYEQQLHDYYDKPTYWKENK